ncbi:MAG: hypothetical protein WDO24_25190 [Pseudomonadota bacterium]
MDAVVVGETAGLVEVVLLGGALDDMVCLAGAAWVLEPMPVPVAVDGLVWADLPLGAAAALPWGFWVALIPGLVDGVSAARASGAATPKINAENATVVSKRVIATPLS